MDSEWESMLEEDKARKASVGVPSSQMWQPESSMLKAILELGDGP
jgi:hypothetical protein